MVCHHVTQLSTAKQFNQKIKSQITFKTDAAMERDYTNPRMS